MTWATELWEMRWIVVVAIALFVFYVWDKYMSQETISVLGKNLTRKDMRYFLHTFGIIFILWLCRTYWFYEVKNFFYMSVALFSGLGALIWYWTDRKNDVYVIENTMQGEEMFHLGLIKNYVVGQTGIRMFRMPIHVYEAKEHQGDLSGLFWKKGRMIFTDWYDGKTFYHPEHPDLHNINFYQAMNFWLTFKKKYPEVALKILELTWLREWSIVDALDQLEDKSFMSLAENRMQHPVPFDISMTRRECYNKLKAQRTFDLSSQETIRGKDEAEPAPATKPTLKDMEALDGKK